VILKFYPNIYFSDTEAGQGLHLFPLCDLIIFRNVFTGITLVTLCDRLTAATNFRWSVQYPSCYSYKWITHCARGSGKVRNCRMRNAVYIAALYNFSPRQGVNHLFPRKRPILLLFTWLHKNPFGLFNPYCVIRYRDVNSSWSRRVSKKILGLKKKFVDKNFSTRSLR